MTTLRVDGHAIELTNEDKVLFPGDGITKRELVDYHRAVADHMLPFLAGRPLVMGRFPDGIGEAGFFQKETPDHFPGWIDSVTLDREAGGTVTHVVAGDTATLVYLADQGAIEIHPLLAPAARPRRPDQLILDLDPVAGDVSGVVAGARAVEAVLADLGVTGFVKSTGSRGVHVHIRLDGSADFDEARGTARTLADAVVARDHDRLTTAVRKEQRGDRVFVDWLRNGYAQHAVVPYGVRARPGAPVAVPLDWGEATSGSFDPQRHSIRSVARRLAQKDDPWAGGGRHAYAVASLRDRIDRLAG